MNIIPLIFAFLQTFPAQEVKGVNVIEHSIHASHAAHTYTLDPEILLAMAYVESRFQRDVCTYINDSGKRVGSYSCSTDKRANRGRGPYFSGPLGNRSSDWSGCLLAQDTWTAYNRGAEHLTGWLVATKGDLKSALAGYGCGWHGVKTGKCNRYPERVIGLAAKLKRAASS